MLDADVFRIRADVESQNAATPALTDCSSPASCAPASPAINALQALANKPTDADGASRSVGSPVTLYEDPIKLSRERHAPPQTEAELASEQHQHQVLADRAAASFQQDRRLQRGHIGRPHEQHLHPAKAAPPPVSPTWSGLPHSVLHAGKSPVCLPLPASDSGISDTEHGAAYVSTPVVDVDTATATTGRANTASPRAVSSPSSAAALVAEDDEGDVEYKWRLTGISATRFQHLVTQMQFRVSEGRGQCLYELGVSDDGTPRGLTRRDFDESVLTVQRMAAQLQLEATVLQCCAVVPTAPQQEAGRRAEMRRPPPSAHRRDSPAVEEDTEDDEKELFCGEVMVSRRQSASAHDLSVAFCGAVGCGKSTLMAVLLTARLDDGRGATRQSLFNHKHELYSGRTSSLASRVWTVPPDAEVAGAAAPAVRVDAHATCAPPAPSRFQPSWPSAQSSVLAGAATPPPTPPFTCASPRSITLLDAGGDITKTMLFGLMSRKPDYVCVCVAADSSNVADVTLYAEVCCAMNTPFLLAVTKCDCVEEFELDGLLMELTVALETVGCVAEQVDSRISAAAYCRDWLPRHRDAAVDGAAASASGSPASVAVRLRVPIFCVSCVSGGDGLDVLRACLSHLQNPPPSPPQSPPSCLSKPPFEVLLDCAFTVDNVGPVVHGRVAHGVVEVGCSCYIGPGSDGRFYSVLVRSIHVDGEHVNVAQAGDEATFALDRLPSAVTVAHKGKVLVRQPERVATVFEATVQVVSQSISAHMEPIMYTRNARQAVRVEQVRPAAAVLSPNGGGGEADGHRECAVRCRFLFRPEVVGPSDAVVLHWAPRGIAVGRITAVEPPGK